MPYLLILDGKLGELGSKQKVGVSGAPMYTQVVITHRHLDVGLSFPKSLPVFLVGLPLGLIKNTLCSLLGVNLGYLLCF